MRKNDATLWLFFRRFNNDISITYKGIEERTGLNSSSLSESLGNLSFYKYIKIAKVGRSIYLLDRKLKSDNFKKLTGSKKVVTLIDILVIDDKDGSASLHDFRITDAL